MTDQTLRRFTNPIHSLSPRAILAAAWIAVCFFAQADPTLAQEQASSNRLTTRQGVVGVQLEKVQETALPLCPGGNIHYTVRIQNIGTLAGGAEIFDPIPEGTTYVPGSASGGAGYDAANHRIVWEGPLAPGQSHAIGFSVTVNPGVANGTSIVNRATGRVTVGQTVVETQVEVAVTVQCLPLVARISKSRHFAEPLCPGTNIHYTIRLHNDSPRNAIVDARIEDPIPANTTFAGSLSPDTALVNNKIVWEGRLGPGQSHEIGFSVTVADGAPDGTVITNQATGTLRDPQAGDTATDTVTVRDAVDCPQGDSGLDLKKSSSFEGPLCPGSRIGYEITLTNRPGAQAPLDARIEDSIPAGTTLAGDIDPPQGVTFTDGRLVWEGALASGQSHTLAFDVTVNPGVPDGTAIVNTATAVAGDPQTGLDITGSDRTEDVVDCVDDVKPSEPNIDLRIWLKYAEFVDNMDAAATRGDGDGYGFAAVRIEGVPGSEQTTELGGRNDWVRQDRVEQKLGTGQGLEIYKRRMCCTDRDFELAIDLWENDASDDIYDKLESAAQAIADALSDPRIEAGMAILDAVEELLKLFGIDLANQPPDELGSYSAPDLKSPWVKEPARFSCPLEDAVIDGNKNELTQFHEPAKFLKDRDHILELRTGGADNGRFWLQWKGASLEQEQCNDLEDGADENKRGFRVATSESGPRGAEPPILDLQRFSALQASERELDLDWTFETAMIGASMADVLGRRSSVSFHGLLTTPRDASLSPTPDQSEAWRVEVTFRLQDGQVVADSSVSRWQETEWVPTGAKALEVTLGERVLEATFDHRDLGELAMYSLSAALLEEGLVVDAVPNSPTREFLLAWGDDRTPPRVDSVERVVLDISEGPDAELLPAGSIDEIIVQLSERVSLIPGDVRLEPSVDVDLQLEGRILTIDPREILGGGSYELILSGRVMDSAGNRLDGNEDGDPGGDFRYGFEITGTRLFASDRDGRPTNRFEAGDEIYASGSGFDPSLQLALYLMPTHRVSDGVALEDFTADGATGATTGPSGDLTPTRLGPAQPGEYTLVADLDRDGLFRDASDRRWRDPGIGVAVVEEQGGTEPPSGPPAPPAGPWLTSPELSGFEAKVRITPQGGQPVDGAAEPLCIVETLCASGALPGRPEIFIKVIGPRPNGKLWAQIARFTPSQVEVWLRQMPTGVTRYYRLASVGAASDDVSGLQDREAFDP